MPKFYFHVRDGGEVIRDDEGIEIHDLDAAREEALRSARELMENDVRNGLEPKPRAILIEDDGGTLLDTIVAAEAVEPRQP